MVLVVVGLAIYALALAACAAVGVGLWFLLRYTWRAFSSARPDSGIVKSISAIPPVGRAVLGAIPCIVVSLALMGCFVSSTMSPTSTENNEGQEEQAAQTAGSVAAPSGQQGNVGEESDRDGNTHSNWWDMSVDEFISQFNKTADVPFVEAERFVPGDKNGKYYRTEYRLGAWDDAEGVHGTAGDCSVDIVSYRDGVRLYAIGQSHEAVAQLLDDSLKVYAPGVPEDDRNALVDKALTGDDGSGIAMLDNGLNGYVIDKTLMIERTGKSNY